MLIFHFHQHSENWGPKLWGVGNLIFFSTIDINKMAAIFQLFHNGWHWYSVSINTRKTRDPNFGGEEVIWNFSIRLILTKWQPFFNFFIMANTDILFPLTGDPNFGGVGNLTFFCTINIKEMATIFQFFHNGRHWYSISVDTWKTGDQNFGGVGNLKFFHTIDINEMAAIFQFFHNCQCWYSVDTRKTGEMRIFHGFSFLLVQFSPSPFLGSISTLMCGYA